MKFIKENSYDIVRLYINQIGISIFSLVLYTAVGKIEDESLNLGIKIAVSVFSMLFYFALLYTVSWEWGAKDKIRIDAGRLEVKKSKALIMSVFANISNFIFAIICTATVAMYMLGLGDIFYTISGVFNLIMRLLAAMYLGFLQGVFAFASSNSELYYLLQSIGYIFCPLLAVGVTHLGYIFGLNEKKIFPSAKNNRQHK